MPNIACSQTVSNKLFAFDFDGVICDSAVETAHSGWKMALQIWTDMPADLPPSLLNGFREVRPVLETGYEAALILRLLFEDTRADALLDDFHSLLEALLIRDNLQTDELKLLFGETRDSWLKQDFDNWIAMNPLFTQVADKLRQLDPQQCVIITTKQERFVSHILSANQILFPLEHIYGLERNVSKQQILIDLSAEQRWQRMLFIEDRLPTLINVITDDRLDHVELYLADWGYNTIADRQHANNIQRIRQLTLDAVLAL